MKKNATSAQVSGSKTTQDPKENSDVKEVKKPPKKAPLNKSPVRVDPNQSATNAAGTVTATTTATQTNRITANNQKKSVPKQQVPKVKQENPATVEKTSKPATTLVPAKKKIPADPTKAKTKEKAAKSNTDIKSKAAKTADSPPGQSRKKEENPNKFRYQIIFNNYLVHLLNRLHELESLGYEGVKAKLDHCYLKYMKFVDTERADEYLDHIHDRFQDHIKLIAEQDDFLFSEEHCQGDLKLISGLDLYGIWQFLELLENQQENTTISVVPKTTDDNNKETEREQECLIEEKGKTSAQKAVELKEIIWKSLTNLYVSCCLATGRTADTWASSIMQNLRLAKKLEKEIEQEPEEEETGGVAAGLMGGLPNIADIEKIFNGENAISQIFSDVKNELNPEEYMRELNPENKPPLELIMGLFSGQNTDRFQNVAMSLTRKFAEKVNERGLTEDDLKNAMKDMQKDFAKLPGIGPMLAQLNTDDIKLPTQEDLATNPDGTRATSAASATSATSATSDGVSDANPNVPADLDKNMSQLFANFQQGFLSGQMPGMDNLQNGSEGLPSEFQEQMQKAQNDLRMFMEQQQRQQQIDESQGVSNQLVPTAEPGTEQQEASAANPNEAIMAMISSMMIQVNPAQQ